MPTYININYYSALKFMLLFLQVEYQKNYFMLLF